MQVWETDLGRLVFSIVKLQYVLASILELDKHDTDSPNLQQLIIINPKLWMVDLFFFDPRITGDQMMILTPHTV